MHVGTLSIIILGIGAGLTYTSGVDRSEHTSEARHASPPLCWRLLEMTFGYDSIRSNSVPSNLVVRGKEGRVGLSIISTRLSVDGRRVVLLL